MRGVRGLRSVVGRPFGRARGRSGRLGFTLIEALVAIGVIALVGVGLAAIFQTVSDTVSGGRRISRFAQTAALIERQMRHDFDRMSRDGVLVIRHQFAQANPDGTIEPDPTTGVDTFDGVALSSEDAEPRLRRIDEIVFFARGEFESARQPLHPTLGVESSEARIYYGHGRKARTREVGDTVRSLPRAPYFYDADAALREGTRFMEPESWERGLGVLEGGEHPNLYAGDWILLRQATLLVPPSDRLPDTSAALKDLFGTMTPPANPGADPFNTTVPSGVAPSFATQVYQGQPAARFLFRDVIRSLELNSSDQTLTVRSESDTLSPRFDSGLVDVALTTIAETMAVIERSDLYPPVDPTAFNPTGNRLSDSEPPIDDPVAGVTRLLAMTPRMPTTVAGGERRIPTGGPIGNRLATIHAWMEQLLPAFSLVVSGGTERGERARAEVGPTDFEAVITDENSEITSGVFASGQQLAIEVARGDQLALSMSNLAPRCSEFIVEWSFGQTYTQEEFAGGSGTHSREGELVWYGGTAVDPMTNLPESIVAYPAGAQSMGDAPIRGHRPFPTSAAQQVRDHVVPTTLIYGSQAPQYPNLTLDGRTCYFGRTDPTYPQTGGGTLEPGAPASVPWAWPKLVRVTFSLADPLDPTIEETYQFVFELPENPEP